MLRPGLRLHFVMAERQNLFFAELVAALREELAALGTDTALTVGDLPDLARNEVGVLVPPHEYFALTPSASPRQRLLERYVCISAEQPETHHFADNVRIGMQAGALLDINPRAVRSYQHAGIRARHLPLGYHSGWDPFGSLETLLAAERDIDVVFMGCITPRRGRYLAGFATTFDGLATRLVISDNTGPNDRPSDRFVSGNDKRSLLSRAKVIVNLHQGEEAYFEWMRALEAIHAGCVLVSEHATDHAPLVAGEHFLAAEAQSLGELASYLANEPQERLRLAANAYEMIRKHYPLRSGAQLLRSVAEEVRRAGARDLRLARIATQVPAPITAPLAQPAESDTPLPPNTATKPDPADQQASVVHPPSLEFDATPQERALNAFLKEVRLDLLDMRRAASRLQLYLTDFNGRKGQEEHRINEIEILAETPAWHAATWHAMKSPTRRGPSGHLANPAVTVITPSYNHAPDLARALESVSSSVLGDLKIELVVIDDASTDSTPEVLRAFARANPHLAFLALRHRVNRGLPRARNLGLAVARGAAVFPLDADNELLPHGLARLARALEENPSASFAYGILACHDNGEPTRLLSYFPWEPERLLRFNYVDAASLIRTDVIRSMGGYTTDRRLHGWEDYDLYCRLAELDHTAAFVPEMVALYLESPTSMRSLTDISHMAAFAALKEHAPRLMSPVVLPA